MHFPPGYKEWDENGEELCLRVDGNIYGTKDGGRSFTDYRDDWLVEEMGFVQSEHDPSLFIREPQELITEGILGVKRRSLKRIVLGTWIDDSLFVTNAETATWFEGQMNLKWTRPSPDGKGTKKCEIKEADFVIGMDVEQEPGCVKVHQGKLATKLVEAFDLQDCFPKTMPFPSGATVNKLDCPDLKHEERFHNANKYRSGVATVLYLACTTRPELAKYASELGKVQANPGEKHFTLLIHLIMYIAGTKTHGLIYKGSDDEVLCDTIVGFCDASWADDVNNRRSTSGYVAYLNGAPVSWHSRLMHAIALSSAESELYAATDAAKDITHIRWVWGDITGIEQTKPTVLYEDNNAVIAIASDHNKSLSTRTKHIAARYFWVRAKVYDGTIVLQRCDTTEQVADALTKASLGRAQFEKFRDRLVSPKSIKQQISPAKMESK
jgi:histone deacetylase 1/2